MRTSILMAPVTLICLAALSSAPGQQTPDSTLDKDIVFANVDGQELRLDLVRPTTGKGPFPLVLLIHGGGWIMGDRTVDQKGVRDMTQLGYAVASVQYRLAPAHMFPAQLDDVRRSLAFLRTNAAKYNLDPKLIVVAGASAGGHLALMLGLTDKGVDKGAPRVRAIVDMMGPTDFHSWKITKDADDLMRRALGVDLDGLIADFVGTSDRQDRRLAEVSPITYVRKDSPTVLIIHGTVDTWVPFQQAQVLYDALKRAGVTARLVPLEGAGHFDVFWPPEQRTKSRQEMVQFLKQVFEQN